MCIPTSLVNLARLVNHPCGECMEICYDDEAGPYTLRRAMEITITCILGDVLRRGFDVDVGTHVSIRARLQVDGAYLLVLDQHAVGLKCEDGNVYIVDDCQANVLVGPALVVVRELAHYDRVAVWPVLFGGVTDGDHIPEEDMQISAGGHLATEHNGSAAPMKRPASFNVVSPKKGKHRMRAKGLRKTTKGPGLCPAPRLPTQ